MKLIYFTPKRFQFFSADSSYVLQLAEGFRKILKDNFVFVFLSKEKGSLENFNEINLGLNYSYRSKFFSFYIPLLFFMFWTPYFLISRKLKSKDNIFFLGDTKLLALLIFWRNVLGYQYLICSDWHMYYDNFHSRYSAKNSDSLVLTSEKLKKMIVSKTNISPDKILVAYGGTDLSKFRDVKKQDARKALNLPLDKKLVAYVGLFKTMGMEKGIDTMMAALPFLDESVVMVFVGAREGEIESYSQMAESLKIRNRCLIIEKQDLDKMALFQQAMDILVIPYPDQPHFRDFGFPMKIYDYMAAKRPVVYSKLEMVEEVIAKYGTAFTADDPQDLAASIKKVFSSYTEAEEKAALAYEAVKGYSWEKKAERVLSFLGK